MTMNSVMCKKPMDNVIETIKETGITILGSKGCGKSNALMCIISELSQDSLVCVIDFATVHGFELGEKFTIKFLNEDYLLRKPKLSIERNIIFDISQTTKSVASEIIRNLIKEEYYARVKEVIEDFNHGKTERKLIKPWLIFCMEEAQTIIGRYLKEDSDLRTAMAVGRNYKMNFIFVTQRTSELDTSLSERSSYLIGKTVGDNNIRKLSNLLGIPRKKLKFVETLQKGEFVFFNGERVEKVKFPLFNGSRVALETEIVKRKPKSLWKRLKESFKSQPQQQNESIEPEPEEKEYECPQCGQPCSEEEYESGYCLDCDQIEMFGD